MIKNFPILVSLFIFLVFSINIFGQQTNFSNQAQALNNTNFNPSRLQATDEARSISAAYAAYPNPMILNLDRGCDAENLNPVRFDSRIDAGQRVAFCEALQEISVKLNNNWSPALKSEVQQIWQVFIRENVTIRPMKEGVSSRIIAGAEAFTNRDTSKGFNASFYLRPDHAKDKSFFLVFMHELRHVYDFYTLWKNQTSINEAELEKRGFRIMGKIYQELPDKPHFFRMPTFWNNDWKNLSQSEIERRREEKIEDFMRGNDFYKNLLKSPETHPVGYNSNQMTAQKVSFNPVEEDEEKGERLPLRMSLRQTGKEIPQQVKELSFKTEKAANPKNPDELLRAALLNEKNLYRKMDNFVYDQSLQLQCWKKQQVSENYELNRLIARTENGEALFQGQNAPSASSKSGLPSCVLNFNSIKTDATETFWAAPYLDEMPVKFEYFTEVDGIQVARYTVLQPTMQKFNEIAAKYPKIQPFRVFVGTIFIAVEDSQIIKFWGTSFPEANTTGNQSTRTYASYCATAVRQKLASGIWVTTLLNTVAVTNDKNKMKPFSYVVKYQNYRQGDSDVKILDDNATAVK